MIKKFGVLVLGALEQDTYLAQIPGLTQVAKNEQNFYQIAVGANLKANEKLVFSGGVAANVALSLAKWGVPTAVVSLLGGDGVAWQIRNDLDSASVDTTLIQIDERIPSACNYHLFDRGTLRQSIISLSVDWRQLKTEKIKFFDYNLNWAYVASLGGNFDAYDNLLRNLKLSGFQVLFNPGGDELADLDKFYGLLEDVDILLVNRSEAEKITRSRNLENMVRKLAKLVNLVIITSSEDGVIVSDGQSIWRAGVYQKVASVDRTGVGDAFGAGFLYKFMQNGSVAEAIVFASANAASVIGKIGGTTATIEATSSLSVIEVREKSINE